MKSTTSASTTSAPPLSSKENYGGDSKATSYLESLSFFFANLSLGVYV